MILEHFGFQKEPFARDIPVEELVRFDAHREMTARLHYAAEHRQTALVTGDTGAGKTTAVRAAMKRLDNSRYRFMYIASRGLTQKTLYRELLGRMQIQPRFRLLENQNLVHQAFEESFGRGQEWVLIIDECQELDANTLAEFRFVLNHRTDSFSPLSLWLVGQTELREKLRLRVLAPLSQRIPIRYHMAGLTEPEVAGYIEEQLKRAGREETLFREEAVKGVAKWSQGNPRIVGTLCRAALLDAAARKDPHVAYEHVERAWNEVNSA